jgi:monoamine oxidase
MSGLAAARALRELGHPVTVLEARDRVGGRMRTDELSPKFWEDGAVLGHGTLLGHYDMFFNARTTSATAVSDEVALSTWTTTTTRAFSRRSRTS